MVNGKIRSMRRSWTVKNLTDFVVDSVKHAHADDAPFYHLRFDRIFPDDFYVEMLQAMPMPEDYRAMSGKSKMEAADLMESRLARRSTFFPNTFVICLKRS